jgi:hypothetical protein
MTMSTIFGGDTYDLAYDIWIIKSTSDPTNFTANDIKCELMIWPDSKNATPDGVAPSGSLSQLETVARLCRHGRWCRHDRRLRNGRNFNVGTAFPRRQENRDGQWRATMLSRGSRNW